MKIHVFLACAAVHALILLGCGAPASPPRLSVRITDFGVMEPVGAQQRTADPSSATGFITRGDAVFRSHVTTVPAIQGLAFGFAYRIDGMPAGRSVRLTRIIRHPPMKKPDGTVITQQVSSRDERSDVGALDAKAYYTMREPYEVVPGRWTITVLEGDTVLAEQAFTVGAEPVSVIPRSLADRSPT